MATKNRLVVFDFTLKADAATTEAVKQFLNEWAKKWVFQLERSDEGYEHYQGRVSLIKKRRLQELINAVQCTNKWPWHWSASSSNSLGDDAFYCVKADTRIDGPWKNTDEVIYIPRQIREVEKLRPWQQQIVDDRDTWDKRHINMLVDTFGNSGKSTLKGYIRAYKLGRPLPFLNDYKDLLAIIMAVPISKLYVIDIPRSLRKDQMYGFFAAIEALKDGYACDQRYAFKEKYFDCPNIWIFTNKMPDTEYLSLDRWRIWNIIDDNLVRV